MCNCKISKGIAKNRKIGVRPGVFKIQVFQDKFFIHNIKKVLEQIMKETILTAFAKQSDTIIIT